MLKVYCFHQTESGTSLLQTSETPETVIPALQVPRCSGLSNWGGLAMCLPAECTHQTAHNAGPFAVELSFAPPGPASSTSVDRGRRQLPTTPCRVILEWLKSKSCRVSSHLGPLSWQAYASDTLLLPCRIPVASHRPHTSSQKQVTNEGHPNSQDPHGPNTSELTYKQSRLVSSTRHTSPSKFSPHL